MSILVKEKNDTNCRAKAVFGTAEWAAYTENFIDGCKHNCKYCYSKEMAIRFQRKTADSWSEEIVRRRQVNKKFKKMTGTIMFPSSHDIHPENLTSSMIFLENMLYAGNRVLIVTKPHLRCIKAISDKLSFYKNKILFRFTIGSANNEVLSFWEPGAPLYQERLASLQYAYNNGFKTSLSCEPMLDDNINQVIIDTSNYITDHIWIGKVNFLLRRIKMNGCDDTETIRRATELLNIQADNNIVDLYNNLKDNPIIKWKESIKNVVGIEVPTEKGLDI
ncbi:MAG: hypothetical protein DKM50_03485 [Candidatus Margulisiibacteriota bacterium]|nr:MAG: hypothetical protein A2X42_02140 [Candidatus Margulisbacteria bacterium GWF2_38_17]OGI09634.1 MAG: hypothetical protein A2X41_04850 [Candidatus Margulisbacteria bacterium GWE2_39_32]PZM83040.1 MAG: hypothetical protein DKM50_03485 [Candidatus Margulisiibacteriota bacterium]HCT86467.1 hypothetical protein [Candidatus Margulisiibacteriota bacterium]HCY35957.1 hypothetical protein [Candidatus Margulisiibacteriota bacterium]